MQLGTFTADVTVDGKALEQYDITLENPTQVACWIPSEEGKSFSVTWTCTEERRTTDIQVELYVDGTGCAKMCRGPPAKFGVNSTGVFTDFINSRTRRELMFARVRLSDDDSLLSKIAPKHSGEIRLTVSRGSIVLSRNTIAMDLPVSDDYTFHEKNKKAAVHCLGFGPATPIQPSSYRRDLIPNDDPALTFVFKYRPLSILQADGIAPRPTVGSECISQENSTSEYGVGDGDKLVDPSQDIKPAELNDRIRSLQNELKRLRDLQGDISGEQKPKRIKREERKRALFTPGEIIDLT